MKRIMNKRLQWMTALLVIASLALPWTAFADNVIAQVNDVEASGDNTLRAGSSITASYWIVANSGDGGDQQPGCNASDGSPAKVKIVAPTGITATPAELTFTACDKTYAQDVTFQSATAGTYEISTAVQDAAGGTYNTNPSKFTLTVLEGDGGSGSGDLSIPPADTTAPVITPNVAGSLGSNGWYVSDVTVSFDVVDNESAISSQSGCGQAVVNTDTAGVTFTCTATSAGGTSSASVSVKRDATAPSVSIGNVLNFYYAFPPTTAPTVAASDNLSGLAAPATLSGLAAPATLSGYDAARLPGAYPLKANAADLAGNTATASAAYTIMAWTTNGFFQPVDMGGIINTVKAGSTVPLKFELFAGAAELTETSRVKSFSAVPVSCSTGTEDDIEVLATGGTSLRYDATAGQYVYNWQTPKLPGNCYKLTMTAQDGSTISANFKLK